MFIEIGFEPDKFHFKSPLITPKDNFNFQTFDFKEILVGNYFKITFIGKTRRCSLDNIPYVAVERIKVFGVKISHLGAEFKRTGKKLFRS